MRTIFKSVFRKCKAMTYEKFEHKAVGALLEGSDPISQRLFDQFLDAEVQGREETENGFVVNYKVPEYLAIDGLVKQTPSVLVKLARDEMLRIELITSVGLITNLKATYAPGAPQIKYSELVRRLSDLTFSVTTQQIPFQEVPVRSNKVSKTVKKPEVRSLFKQENRSPSPEINLAKNSELLEKSEQLLFENIQIKKLLEEEQDRTSKLLEKSEQLLFEKGQTKQLLESEQAKNSDLVILLEQEKEQNLKLTENSETLLVANAQAKKLLEQERKRNTVLVEKSEQLLLENSQVRESLEQEQAKNINLLEKSEELLTESDQVKELLKKEQERNVLLAEKSETLLAESVQVKTLLEQEQVRNAELIEKSEQSWAENIQVKQRLEQEQAKNSELLGKSAQLLFENNQTRELLEQEQAKNSELLVESEQLFSEGTQAKELLDQKQARNEELLGKSEQLQNEKTQTQQLLEKERIENIALIEETAKLLAENTQANELLKQEQTKKNELLEKSDYLLLESIRINELLEQRQVSNLDFDEKVQKFKKSLAYFKFESILIGPKEVEDQSFDKQSLVDVPANVESEKSEPVIAIESQREKLADPFEEATDHFLTKLFRGKKDIKKYRTKTKYHMTVWKLAFTIGINTLFYLFFAMTLIIILLSGVQGESGEPRSVMGFSAMRVVSESMEPSLQMNSLIIVRQTDPVHLEVGQVATYLREDGLLITHRIHYIEKDEEGNREGFVLRGDANLVIDDQVVSNDLMIGRVVFTSYAIGMLLLFFQNHFILMIVITIVLFSMLYIGKRSIVSKFIRNGPVPIQIPDPPNIKEVSAEEQF